jgi:hypothetical protein
MQIGEPLRTVIVEPLEIPLKQPTSEPAPVPAPVPVPVKVPVARDYSRLHLAHRGLSRVAMETD